MHSIYALLVVIKRTHQTILIVVIIIAQQVLISINSQEKLRFMMLNYTLSTVLPCFLIITYLNLKKKFTRVNINDTVITDIIY
jgi:hypothetical protein